MSALMPEVTRPGPLFGLPPDHEWTIEDLALLPDDGRRYEIIDGSLVMAPAPAINHQLTCHWLQVALETHRPGKCAVVPGANVRIPAPGTRILVPDVSAADLAGLDLRGLEIPASRILLAVEVVSPSSVTTDRVTKMALYAEAGIRSYWLVEDGDLGCALRAFDLAGGMYKQVAVVGPGETTTLDAPWPVTVTPPAW